MKKIDYIIEKDGLVFSDAIILNDNETLSDEDIELIKKTRFDNWYKVITTTLIDDVIYEEIVDGS